MKCVSKLGAAAVAALTLGLAGAAQAADFAYMTGTSNPWGQSTEDAAMDLAFGAGAWDKYNGFNASIFSAGYAFIYFDGGDGVSGQFDAFIGANVGAVESFVNAGGRILTNAARWTNPTLNLGFGTTLVGDTYSSNATLTADGLLAGLDANGAGTDWTGGSFSHDIVTGVDVCYVTGDNGCVFGAVTEGLFVGGQTAPFFHNPSTAALQLRANQLQFAATGAVNVGGAVPEPGTWALMIGGFGLAGAALRRRRVFA